MPDLAPTPADVIAQSGAQIEHGVYGETVDAGEAVYLKNADNKWWLADANASTATASAAGIALNSGGADQKGSIIEEGDVAMGSVFTIGTGVVLSATPGKLAPTVDLATGDYVTFIGMPISATTLRVKRIVTGSQHA